MSDPPPPPSSYGHHHNQPPPVPYGRGGGGYYPHHHHHYSSSSSYSRGGGRGRGGDGGDASSYRGGGYQSYSRGYGRGGDRGGGVDRYGSSGLSKDGSFGMELQAVDYGSLMRAGGTAASHPPSHEQGQQYQQESSNGGGGDSEGSYVASTFQYYTVAHQRTQEEIQQWMEQHQISMYGEAVPQPIFTFSELVAPEAVHATFESQGYAAPTPIQCAAWPILLQSRDFVGIAKTGSGKTLAFMVPAVLHILAQPPLRLGDGPIALVLAPTRELALQIEDESRKLTSRITNMKSTCIYGGTPKYEQSRALRAGVQIVIATPGRLIDMLSSRATNLFRVTFLVLDEADRMLDMGFEPSIRTICGQIRPDRQTLMFSATWPDEIRALAASFQRNFIRIHVGSEELLANSDVRQHFAIVSEGEKLTRLMDIFNSVPQQRILIFTKTKKMADQLFYMLRRNNVWALVIHGDKDQAHRDQTLDEFKRNERACLVATDVAARGLDIKALDIVINYDFPTNIEDYVHRIGRTGRAGKKGDAFTFLTRDAPPKVMQELCDLVRRAGQDVPEALLEMAGSRYGSGGYGRGGYGSGHRGGGSYGGYARGGRGGGYSRGSSGSYRGGYGGPPGGGYGSTFDPRQ